MGDNESKSPWDNLASDLGVDPADESFERKQSQSIDIPAAKSESAEEVLEPRKASPGEWNTLANSLGVEVDDEPFEEAEVSAEVPVDDAPTFAAEEVAAAEEKPTDRFEPEVCDDRDSDDTLPPLPSEIDQVMGEEDWLADEESAEDDATQDEPEEASPGISGEAARNAFDALFTASGSAWAAPGSEEEVTESAVDRSGASESSELGDEIVEKTEKAEKGSEDDDEESRPRRRRPRRRRRGRGGRKPVEEKAVSDDEEKASDEGEESLAEKTSSAKDEEEKPRRRRPRRRSRRSASKDDPTTEVKKSTEHLDDEDDSDDDGLEEQVGRGAARSRSSHRNLPTWSEAIGGIVDSNLAQRSKSPSKPNSSRGGRGRGGRRRGGGKKA